MRVNSKIVLSHSQIVLLTATICSVLLYFLFGVRMLPDSGSYIRAWENLKSGSFDVSRTPVYPFIYGAFKECVGKTFALHVVIILQHVLFVVSSYCFYQIAKQVFISERIAFWIAVFYSVCPALNNWSVAFQTESFALSFLVFFVYFIVVDNYRNTYYGLFSSIVFLFLLVFLRPSFIYLFPVMLVYWTVSYFKGGKSRIRSAIGVVGIVLVFTSLFFYMKSFQKQYGIFASSNVSVTNQYYIGRQYGVIDPKVIDDTGLKEFVRNSYKDRGILCDEREYLWDFTHYIMGKYDLVTTQDAITKSAKAHRKEWIRGLFSRVYYASRHPLLKSPIEPVGFVLDVFGLSLNSLNMLLALWFVALFMNVRKFRKIPCISSLIIMIVAGNLAVTYIAGNDEWSRLNMPVLPFSFILGCLLIEFVRSRNRMALK